MMLIDEPTMPRQPHNELRAEVERRSGRLRRRRRHWGAATTGGAVVTVVALLALASSPATDTRVTSRPGGEGGTEQEGAEPHVGVDGGDGVGDGGGGGPAARTPRPSPTPTGQPRPSAAAPGATLPGKYESRPTRDPGITPLSDPSARMVFWDDKGYIVEMGLDGSGKRRLWHTATANGRISPDGTYLLFSGTHYIDVRNTHTETHTTVFWSKDEPGGQRDRAIGRAWMPDGRIVFVREHGDPISRVRELWTLDIGSGELRRLRAAPDASETLSVSGNGRIAYDCEVADEGRVCVTDGAGADLGHIPNSFANSRYALAPDGQWLAYRAGDGVAILRADGTQRREVVRTRVTGAPVWLPDSTRVAFSLTWPDHKVDPCIDPPPCPDDGGIWSVRIDGTDTRPITTGAKDLVLDMRLAR